MCTCNLCQNPPFQILATCTYPCTTLCPSMYTPYQPHSLYDWLQSLTSVLGMAKTGLSSPGVGVVGLTTTLAPLPSTSALSVFSPSPVSTDSRSALFRYFLPYKHQQRRYTYMYTHVASRVCSNRNREHMSK